MANLSPPTKKELRKHTTT